MVFRVKDSISVGAHKTRVHDHLVDLETTFCLSLDGVHLFSSFLKELVYIELSHSELFLPNFFKTFSLSLKSIKLNDTHLKILKGEISVYTDSILSC